MRSNLTALTVSRVNKMLPILRGEAQQLTAHLNFLADICPAGNVDARALCSAVNAAKLSAIRLDKDLVALISVSKSLRRRGLGDSYGMFHANMRALSRKLGQDFIALELAIERLEEVASDKMNDPLRWRDVGVDPLTTIVCTATSLLRLEILSRRK